MKLIAETLEENAILDGLSALLQDLGVVVEEYRTDEVFAITFWSASEVCHMYSDACNFSHEDASAFLTEIEPFLQAAMADAGVHYLDSIVRRRLQKDFLP